ncbi:unnamed protein product [Durusdinium trenchii]|uniref:F-box domain-containing protein n=1 Tax=Durusdinium trenchii TaxID=1381693 RepID=A0ABP0LF95_9DINO
MQLLPHLPDAILGVVSALPLTDALAIRVTSKGVEASTSEGLLRLKKLDLTHPVAQTETTPPACLGGVQYLILRQGISSVKGHLPDLAEELAAAVAFALQLPRLQRIDLTRYDCSLLFSKHRGHPQEAPLLPHCFVASEGSFQSSLEEASVWAQLLKGAQGKRTEPRDDWSTTLRTVRAAACSAAGVAARSFVAHVVCNEGTEALISDLQMLPNLVELQLVTRALPALERLDELFAHGAQRPQTLETQQAHHLRTCAPVQGCPLCAQHLRDRD